MYENILQRKINLKKTMNKRKSIMLFALCLALCACSEKKESQNNEALTVTTEKATLSNDYAQMPYVGCVKEESATMVSFTGMGVLKTLSVSEGQKVHKGQLLAVIDDAQAKSALEAAKAMLDQALDAEARMKQLHDLGSLPDMKWIEVQSQVQQARSSYDMCKKAVDDCKAYAPVSGVVGAKIMGVGENVLPTEPVLNILQIDRVKVQVSIPEKEISQISETTPTTISVEALGGKTFEGGRIEKGVSADAMTHTYNIYIQLSNADHTLLPGMVATVRFGNEQSKPAITLPVKAVQKDGKGMFVWTKQGDKAQRTSVELGETVGNRVIIQGGALKEGMEVVVEGYQKLSEGTKIK